MKSVSAVRRVTWAAGLVLVGLFAIASVASAAAQGNPLIGTWKLDVARSRYSPIPPPRSETVVYEAVPGGVKYIVRRTDADGSRSVLRGVLVQDGRAHAATGTEDYDTVATTRIDAYTGETIRRKDGKVVQTVKRVVSKDGRTLTLTTTGVDARGTSIHNVGVYDRQ
ncbi:MAG TPA: hypothetical protein VNE16_04265 [Vicinamibacterales bacterium]|nr:hypothetical protein [Vicinamibacterales bacterium]